MSGGRGGGGGGAPGRPVGARPPVGAKLSWITLARSDKGGDQGAAWPNDEHVNSELLAGPPTILQPYWIQPRIIPCRQWHPSACYWCLAANSWSPRSPRLPIVRPLILVPIKWGVREEGWVGGVEWSSSG